jgi:hypothetical protein
MGGAALLSLLLLLLSTSWGEVRSTAAAPTARGWDYTIRVDESLQRMDVRICFRGYVPKTLIFNRPEGAAALSLPEAQPGGVRLEQSDDGRVLRPIGLPDGGCLEYTLDLRALASARGRTAFYVGGDFVAAPGALFLRPTRWTADLAVTARFELPSGLRPAVPWAPLAGGRYGIDHLAFQLLGQIAIGRFPVCELQVAGTDIDIAVLDARTRASVSGIRTWIGAAASAVADLYGRFPMPRLLVLVQPTPSRGEPVVFGLSMRAGGGHANLLLSSLARDEELPGEWVAVHEFTHLGLPWTYDQEAWFQEGFVTYYQEVLRGRAGFYSEQEAWQKMEDGLNRGRRRGGDAPLESESRTMRSDHGYRRVYWAGAAIAFLIDVEMRRVSGGVQSLDDVMRVIHARFGAAPKPHSGVELLRAADRALGRSIAAPIAEQHLLQRSFPDVRTVQQALGIIVEGGRVRLDEGAPMAAVRKAIMSPRAR